MSYPVLYSFRRCPYAMRARMALYHAGVQCDVREILLKDKPPELLEISSKATVPVLQLLGGEVIDESLDIMLWALADDDPWLYADAKLMAALIDNNDHDFKHHLDRYKYPQRFEGVDGEQHFHAACLYLVQLENLLETTGAFLFGQSVSMADIAIFPFVRQFSAVDRPRFESLAFVQLRRWLNFFLADESFQQMMSKQKAWQQGDTANYLF